MGDSPSSRSSGRLQIPRHGNGLLGHRLTQEYTGRSMKDFPPNLMITATEWEAFLDDLQQTLDQFAVPQGEQAEIKAIVASTRADIVV